VAELVCAPLESPVGPLLAVASERGLCGLPFIDADRDLIGGRFGDRLRKWFATNDVIELVERPDQSTLVETRAWLEHYFAGRTPEPLPPLDLPGARFELSVWQSLLDIPIGTTTSYGELARRIGSPGAARAVGLANGANPVPILVPCHRVIGAAGSLTGYGGGLARKAFLLDHERRHWGAKRLLQF
jgi:O-6-methylguanine DNA methyltransferase